MRKVAIVMGSGNDMSVMVKAAEMLEQFGVPYEMRILSAHRTPDALAEYMKMIDDDESDYGVVIAGAGKAAALPGDCAARTIKQVIGVPIKTSDLGGLDSLYSIVQMPTGVPVATVAINGAANAALLAIEVLASNDRDLAKKLREWRQKQAEECTEKDTMLQEQGYEAFLS